MILKTFQNLLAVLAVITLLTACRKQEAPQPITENKPLQFIVVANSSTDTLSDSALVFKAVGGDTLALNIPVLNNQKVFALKFNAGTATIKVGDVVQQSGVTTNDFTNPVTYTSTDTGGNVKQYVLSLTNFTGLPIFYINTSAPVVSKDDYVSGRLAINANGQFIQEDTAFDMQIKGRGNSTWGLPKKPYKIKLNSKASVLGLTAAKNWVLLANYSDKTLMRNFAAFKLGEYFGAEFTPHYRFVEVVMNGEHLGNYMLTEQVEINKGRVDIKELDEDDNSGNKVTGGYLLEWDHGLNAELYFTTTHNLPMTLADPDELTNAQFAYIKNYFQQAEDAIFADNFTDTTNGYNKYITISSFISWYLVKELMKDSDAQGYSSIFFYKDRGEKLNMGPIWDFDLSGGNIDYTDAKYPEGWWIKDNVLFARLFQDPAFAAKVKARWEEIRKTAIPALMNDIDKMAAAINVSQQVNFKVWPIMGQYVWPNGQVFNTYGEEVAFLKQWITTRAAWMDANF